MSSCCCRVQLFASPKTASRQASLSFTISQSSLKFTSTSWWCYPTISSSAALFSFCLQSFPASRPVPMNCLCISGGQSIGVSDSVLPMNIEGWFPLGWTGWISLQSKDSQESSPIPQFKSISSLALSLPYGPTLTSIHEYWKNHSFEYMDFCRQSNVPSF